MNYLPGLGFRHFGGTAGGTGILPGGGGMGGGAGATGGGGAGFGGGALGLGVLCIITGITGGK